MNRFELARATSAAQARELLAEKAGSVLKAGGIDLVDHLKEHLVEPPRVVDLKTIPGLDKVTVGGDGSLRIGALVTLAKVASHPAVLKTHPALARACGEAASPQVRNVGTMVNPNLESYKIFAPADMFEAKSILTPLANLGNNTSTAGIGEPPIVPTLAAVANAVYNAIGVRVRELPITPDRVLAALSEAKRRA